MTRRIIRLPEVQARTGLSRSTLYSLISEDTFPCQIPLGARAVGWYEDEVNAWVEQRAAKVQIHASLNLENAAKEAGLRAEELQLFIDSGELPSYRLGRHVLVKNSALAKFKAKHQTVKNSDQ